MRSHSLSTTLLLAIGITTTAMAEPQAVQSQIHEQSTVERPDFELPVADSPRHSNASQADADLQLAEAESLALNSHPSIAEAIARVRAAQGNCLQVGLPPNPTAGYVASEIGSDDSAGQQGMFVGQTFIRGNKLALNRAVACQEVRRLQQELDAQRIRVLTDVRIAFFDVYLAQQQVELTDQLVDVSRRAADSARQLLEAAEVRRTDLLQAEIERERINVQLRQATFLLNSSWRRLAAAMGQPSLALRKVEANPDMLHWPYGWDESRDLLLSESPLIAAAAVEVRKASAAVQRAQAEPVPDVSAQVSVQYDDASDEMLTGVQVGMPIPLWNRNQGGIAEARHDLAAARHRLATLELELTQQLAEMLRQSEASQASATAYREEILERAEENLELVRQAYTAGEVGYLELLTVQRTFFEASLDYLNTLREVNRSIQSLRGLLLSDGQM